MMKNTITIYEGVNLHLMKKLSIAVLLVLLANASFAQRVIGDQQVITTSADGAYSVYAADLDGDGDKDVLSASAGDNKIAWYENQGGSFGKQQVITDPASVAESVYAADLDGDGDKDVLSASAGDNKIAWYENLGDSFGSQQVIIDPAFGACSVYAADLDGDGDKDVLSASADDNKIAWYENQNGGIFGNQQVIADQASLAASVYAADLDGDGDKDVISASAGDDKIAWYENQGGSFGSQQVITTSASSAESVYAADLDGDGDKDVLSASWGDSKIAWYENQGGSFGSQQVITTSADAATSVFAADLNGDGNKDVLSASEVDDKIAWYINQGGGSFDSQQVITTSADGAYSVYAADLDGDGDKEVLSASKNDNKIGWYENNMPVIEKHPENQNTCPSAEVLFTTETTGATDFQWQLDDGSGFSDLSNNSSYSGVTYDTLQITGAEINQSGNLYRCIVSNANVNDTTQSATITVKDNTAPSLTTNDATVTLDAKGTASIKANDVVSEATDNCNLADTALNGVTSYTCEDAGSSFDVDVTAEDANGNTIKKTATSKVEDSSKPTLTTSDLTVELDAKGRASITSADAVSEASDNCSIEDTTLGQSTFSCDNMGKVDVNVTLEDASGNTITQTASVMVEDNQQPSLATNNVTAELDNSGVASITAADVVSSVSDNCNLADTTLSQSTFNCEDVGSEDVNVMVEDANGNSTTHSARVTIEDNKQPSLTTSNVTVELDANGKASITTADMVSDAFDNCSLADTTLSGTLSYTCNDAGSTFDVDITVEDAHGNATTQSATVKVEDNTEPALTTSDTMVELDANGKNSITTSDVVNSTSDNCSLADTTLSQSNFSCSDVGTVDVAVTVEDLASNANTQTATVTVEDNTQPTLTTNDAAVELDASGTASIRSADVISEASDNCSLVDTSVSQTEFTSEDIGEVTVDVTVEDVSGNSTTETAEVTVEEETSLNTISDEKVRVYPNPTEGLVYIDTEIHSLQVKVLNLTGKMLYENNIEKFPGTINLNPFDSGMYIIQLKTDEKVLTRKIMVK